MSKPNTFLASLEEGCIFCFSDRCNNSRNDGADGMHGTVDMCGLIKMAKVEYSSCNRTRSGTREIRGVCLDMENHITGVVSKGIVGVS